MTSIAPSKYEKARKRWLLLAKAIQKETCVQDVNTVSVRRVNHLGLLSVKPIIVETDGNWFEYVLRVKDEIFHLKVCHVEISLTADHLMGFNNTGNICVWPSEEVLAYYCLCKSFLFNNKRVLELGGGMTCLAGILIAKYLNPCQVHVTDGNKTSVANVKRIAQVNQLNVHTSVLKWGTTFSNEFSSKFDVILAADCLFFDDTRHDFVSVLKHCLTDIGIALITAPRRGQTLDLFVQCARLKGLHALVIVSYNETVWGQHCRLQLTNPYYDEDIHYPLLVVVTKCASSLLPFQTS